jgi:hypothetical protein
MDEQMRRNSGDEEIRKLLRSMNENPTAALAERLLATLRRRDEGLAVTVIALTMGGELPLYYEVEHKAELTPSQVVDLLRDAVQNWLDTAQGSEGAPNSLAWSDGLSYLEEKDWKNAGLRLLGTVGADTTFNEDEGFFPLSEEAEDPGLAERWLADDGSEGWTDSQREFVIDAIRAYGASEDPPRFQGDFDLEEFPTSVAVAALQRRREQATGPERRRAALILRGLNVVSDGLVAEASDPEPLDTLVRHYSGSGWAGLDLHGASCPHRHRTAESALRCARRIRGS